MKATPSSVAGRSLPSDEPYQEEPSAPALPAPAQPVAAALPPVQLVPKLTRGMQLRTAISGYGVVVINGRSYLVYRIAVAPRNTSKIWHVFRRYSEFVRLRKELIALSFGYAPFPAVNEVGFSSAEVVESRRVGLQHWLQSLIAGFAKKNIEILDNIALTNFLVTGANMAPDGFKLIKRVLDGAASASPSTTPASMPAPIPASSSKSEAAKKSGGVTIEDFHMVKTIGNGSFGRVFLVRRKETGKLYAMKVLKKKTIKEKHQVEHTRTERRVLGRINHPYIVKLHWAFASSSNLHFVLDYCSGGELYRLLADVHKLEEYHASFYAAEIVLALGHLHSIQIVYRDLKPENILLDGEGHVALADFGLSKEHISSGHRGAGSFCGTAEYLAPEMIKRTGHGTGVDWWALGMVLYEMMAGMPPWYTLDHTELFQRVINKPLEFPVHMSRNACDIISGFLQKDPVQRLGVRGGRARAGKEIMAHPFFGHINWKMMYGRQVPPPARPTPDKGTSAKHFDKKFTDMKIDIPLKHSLPKSLTFKDFYYPQL